MLPENKQMQLVRKFYFDHLPRSNASSVDSSIGTAIRNSAGLIMKKVIENGDDRTELSVPTVNNSGENKKSVFLWKIFWLFWFRILQFFNRKSKPTGKYNFLC